MGVSPPKLITAKRDRNKPMKAKPRSVQPDRYGGGYSDVMFFGFNLTDEQYERIFGHPFKSTVY